MAKRYDFKDCEVFSLRIPKVTYETLAQKSQDLGVSMNSLILESLVKTYGGEKEAKEKVEDLKGKVRIAVEIDLPKSEYAALQNYAEKECRSFSNLALYAIRKLLHYTF